MLVVEHDYSPFKGLDPVEIFLIAQLVFVLKGQTTHDSLVADPTQAGSDD